MIVSSLCLVGVGWFGAKLQRVKWSKWWTWCNVGVVELKLVNLAHCLNWELFCIVLKVHCLNGKLGHPSFEYLNHLFWFSYRIG